MGNFLRALANKAFTYRWFVVAAWTILLVILGLSAAHFYKAPSSAISIPGTQAQETLDKFSEAFPDAGKGSGRIVLKATQEGETLEDNREVIDSVVSETRAIESVNQVSSPFEVPGSISEDGTIGYITIGLEQSTGSVGPSIISDIEAIVENARSDSLQVEMGGDVINKAPEEILGIGEIFGVVLALVVLVVTLGSLVSAGLPIVVALITVATSAAGLFALSEVIDISSTTPVLAIMLGLAVGIDYSLFIVNKYRHYLLKGYGYKEAAERSIATAGNAVIFAAATVVIALSALTIVQIPFMTSMGLAAASTVALAAAIAVTLLPALFAIAGARIFRGKTRRAIAVAQEQGPKDTHRVSHKTIWYRWGELIAKRPIAILVSLVVIIGVLALPARSLDLGLPTDEFAAVDSTERKAYEILKQGFGEGFNSPLIVLAEDIPPVTEEDKQLVRSQLEGAFNQAKQKAIADQTALYQQRMAAIQSPEEAIALQNEIALVQTQAVQQEQQAKQQLEVQITTYSQLYQLNRIAERIADLDGVDQALPALVTDDTKTGMIQVIPTTGPSDEKTIALIQTLRDSSTIERLTDSSGSLGVTGSTALQTDIDDKLTTALPQYLAVVVGLSFVLLVIVFRSILVPIKATLGFLLSVAAMFGVLVVVFQWGWLGIVDAPGPIVSFIPIIAIGILFGLAMDYEFFLVSSIQEEYERTGKAKRAVVDGFAIGSKVVVAAAVIMVAVFAGFVTNHDATIQAMGLGLAAGIFVDAFIVRLMIVPAVMTLLGKHAWWIPKWLERILPRVSIEGKE